MHRREKTAASRMDVRSAAGLGRGSHRSSHTGLSRTASAGGSPVGEEVQGFPAPVWILLQTRYYGDMVYVCLAFNTRGKLRKQTTNCGGIVLTFDIHMSTPFGATSCAAQGQGHNGR